MSVLFSILADLGYPISDDIQEYYDNIDLWQDWWKGYVQKFHKYHIKDKNGNSRAYKRKHLNMAKTICEDWANMLLNDKTRILIECDQHETNKTQAWLTGDKDEQNAGILGANKFWKRGNRAIEREYATGTVCMYWQLTGASVSDGELSGTGLKLRIIKDARQIVPLTYDDDTIDDIALASNYTKDGKKCMYVQIFKKQKDDSYKIENHYYLLHDSGEGGGYEPTDAPAGEVASYILPCKPFVILMPNLENNISDVPMGVSVYANAISNLESTDLAYDNLFMDTLLGKKRIFMDQSAIMLQPPAMAKDESGKDHAIMQDPDIEASLDNTLYVTTGEQLPGTDKFFQEYNPSLRTDENKENVQFNLNLLSAKVGLGQNRYQFNFQSMTTATQVKASNKDLTESVWKQRITIQEALTDLTRAALILGKEKLHQDLDTDARITIQFDDTMFADEEAERMRFMQEISQGIRQRWEYRVKYLGESEEEARKMTGETQQAQGPTLADQFTGGNQNGAQNGGNQPRQAAGTGGSD